MWHLVGARSSSDVVRSLRSRAVTWRCRLVVLVVWAHRRAPHPCHHHLVVTCCCCLVVARRCRVWVFVHVGFGAFVLFGQSASLCGLSLALGTCRGCHIPQWRCGCGRRAAWCGWWCRLHMVGVKLLGVVGVVEWALWTCPLAFK